MTKSIFTSSLRAKQRKPSVALIGLGYWGRNILKTLSQCRLHRLAICDSDLDRIHDAKKSVPQAEIFQNFSALLKDPEITGICIATPVEFHERHVSAALRSGKHVFIEKPLCRSTHEGRKLLRLAKSTGKHVMVGHIYIHHPAVRRLRDWIQSGKLGEIMWIRSTRCSLGPRVRNDVDVLWDYAIHDVYLAPFLMGKAVSKVRADGRAHLSVSRADWVELSMGFQKSKAVFHGFVSWLNPYKERNIMVVGSKGIAVFDELRNPNLTFYRCGYRVSRGVDSWGNVGLELFDKGKCEFSFDSSKTLQIELQHFIDHLDRKSTPEASLSDGLTTLYFLEKLSTSLARKGTWISTV